MALSDLKNHLPGNFQLTKIASVSGNDVTFDSTDGLPVLAGFSLVIWDKDQLSPLSENANPEIVKVSTISSGTYTLTRAQEGSTQRTIAADDHVAWSITKNWLSTLIDDIIAGEFSGDYDDLDNKPTIPGNTAIDDRIANFAKANSPSGTIPDNRIPSSIARDTELFSGDYGDLDNRPTIPNNSAIDGRIATYARANNPSGTIPTGRIPSSIARDSEIPSNTDIDDRIAGYARANSPSGTIPDNRIPSSIARDSETFSGDYDDLTNQPTIPAAPASNRLVPSGGTTGKVLKKTSGSNYDVEWADDETGDAGSGEENVQANWDETSTGSDAYIENKPTDRLLPAGGAINKVLKKSSGNDYDVAWEDDEEGSGATNLSISNRGTEMLEVASSTGTNATVPKATQGLTGLMTSADKAKLDNIENNAEANVGVEYTQTEKTKLDGIETSADANVGVEYSQTEKTKLASVSFNAELNPSVVSQVDARAGTSNVERTWTANRVSEAIEALATGEENVNADWDETDSTEDSYIENKPDIDQEFTQAEKTKLDGIATGAEVNPAVVSQDDAEAGTATDERTWTAERVKQAIEALASGGGGDAGPLTVTTEDITQITFSEDDTIIDFTAINVFVDTGIAVPADTKTILVNYGSSHTEANSGIDLPWFAMPIEEWNRLDGADVGDNPTQGNVRFTRTWRDTNVTAAGGTTARQVWLGKGNNGNLFVMSDNTGYDIRPFRARFEIHTALTVVTDVTGGSDDPVTLLDTTTNYADDTVHAITLTQALSANKDLEVRLKTSGSGFHTGIIKTKTILELTAQTAAPTNTDDAADLVIHRATENYLGGFGADGVKIWRGADDTSFYITFGWDVANGIQLVEY